MYICIFNSIILYNIINLLSIKTNCVLIITNQVH